MVAKLWSNNGGMLCSLAARMQVPGKGEGARRLLHATKSGRSNAGAGKRRVRARPQRTSPSESTSEGTSSSTPAPDPACTPPCSGATSAGLASPLLASRICGAGLGRELAPVLGVRGWVDMITKGIDRHVYRDRGECHLQWLGVVC